MPIFWVIVIVWVGNAYSRPQGILFDNFVNSKKHSLEHKTTTAKDLSGQIYFPQTFEDSIDVVSRINEVPKCANGLPFCENVDSYPYNYLKKVLEKNKILKTFFGENEVLNEEISRRFENEDETFVCRSITKTIFPKVGQNKKNKWKFIINQGEEEGFVQGVQIEICKNPHGNCDFPGGSLMGYQTFCRQKFVYRRLLSLNDRGLPIPDTFKVPSACCCAYKQNFEFLTRFGITSARKKK